MNRLIEDCWNQMGVWSLDSRNCPKLEQFIHCHHCEVYTKAAQKLRDRPIDEASLDAWQAHYASPLNLKDKSDQHSILIFRIGKEWLALKSLMIDEVLAPAPIQSLPHRSSSLIPGIVNIHGRVRICASLHKLLDIEPYSDETHQVYPRMIVMQQDEAVFVFIADEVWGTHRHTSSETTEIPAILSRALAKFTTGLLSLKDKQVGLLDGNLIFYSLEKKLR